MVALAVGAGFGGPLRAQTAPAGNCEPLRQQIEAKFKANGVSRVQLQVVDAAASSPGREVGRCERGSRKIVRVDDAPAATGGATKGRDTPILTECKDGTTTMGGSCRK